VAEHGGRLPTDPAALRRLEGVGEYTAAAMASFAFGQDVAVVDTNVRRVLGRLFWGQSSIAPGPSPRRIHGLAQRLLPPGQAAAWNQALMDLGAKVCLSRKPRCAACPLRPACKAAGTFMSGRAAIAEGRARYQTSRFQGSTRYYRGRILQRLREAADGQGLSLLQLGNGLKPGFAEADLAWLEGLVAGLERDGLARRTPQGVSLP